ncbi:toll/interleukin-1 receptor domain-containing protein [Amycolatopsis sp. NPDC059021]|uniref:toll/interleukin-1 receptor domain-containing protein n=1 Tax=Amycolatopsis sp. NPDC059021 TaxID=3346704 RepID=UPI0036734343
MTGHSDEREPQHTMTPIDDHTDSVSPGRPQYDAFLSYSHAADGRLAPAVLRGFHQLARRWNQVRALRVFRDEESLAANPDLWATIDRALRSSRYFVLMASPDSAKSIWVGREVEYWRNERERETFLIALTAGSIVWDHTANDFDWARTTALPEGLRGWFAAEPLWVDLSHAQDPAQLSVRHSDFRSKMATLAAPVHGKEKEELESDDIRAFRVATRIRRALTTGLMVFLVAATVLGVVTLVQRSAAIDERNQAISRALAARSESLGDTDPELSRLLSVTAWRISPTPEARAGMLIAAARPGIARISSGHGAVNSVAFSPDGKTLATGSDDVRLWDVTTHRQIAAPLAGHTQAVRSVQFSRDGSMLATSGYDAVVRLWNAGTHQQISAPAAPADSSPLLHVAPATAFNPDGKTLAIGDVGGMVRLWDLGGQAQTGEIAVDHPSTPFTTSPSVTFSPDGRTLATAGTDGTVRFWDSAAHQQIGAPLAGHVGDTASFISPLVMFNPDGRTFATAWTDGKVQLWDTATRKPVGGALTAHTRPDRVTLPPSLGFSPDGKTMATGGDDGTIRLWDVGRQAQIGSPLAGHTRAVTSVAFSPDGRTFASGAQDGTIRLWDLGAHLQVSNPMLGSPGAVYALAFSPDGSTIATGGDDGGAVGDHTSRYACGHDGWGICSGGGGAVSVTGAGSTILLYDNPGQKRPAPTGPPRTIMLWDVRTRRPITDLRTHSRRPVLAVAFSPDGRVLATGGPNGSSGDGAGSNLWDPVNRVQLGAPVPEPMSAVRSAVFSQDGRTLVAAGAPAPADAKTDQARPEAKPSVSFWDVETRKQVGTLDVGDTVYSVAASPDGQMLATASGNGAVRLWRTDTRQAIGEPLSGHTGPVGSVAFSPDGRTLASTGDDGTIRLWDVEKHQPLGEPLTGHTGAVYSLAFSPDGSFLATGSGDNSVRVWHIAAHRQISPPYLGHYQPVRSVRFSPDGTTLASAGEDGALRLWDTSFTHNVDSTLCTAVKRPLTPDEWSRHVPELPYRQPCS